MGGVECVLGGTVRMVLSFMGGPDMAIFCAVTLIVCACSAVHSVMILDVVSLCTMFFLLSLY